MAEWNTAAVKERLRKAIGLRYSLSACDSDRGPTANGIGTLGRIGVGARDGARDAVLDEAAEALSWLRWLDPGDTGIIGARLDGLSWKAVCWRYGISRPTADRRYRYGLALIAWRLNGSDRSEPKPSLRRLLSSR